MTSTAHDFGVQSFCFRKTEDNATLAQQVRDIGVDKLEICGVHADFNDPKGFEEIVKTHRDAGVSIVSLGVQTFVGDDGERAWFDCAAAAGAKHISAHFKVDSYYHAMPKVAAMCAEYGIRLAIHCHGGYMFGGSPDVLDYLLELGGPHIGVCIDTAWCMQIGPRQGKPVEWAAERFKGRVYGVHYKDFVFDRNAAWSDVVVGTGNLDLPAFVGALDATGFDGYAVIEYEADPDNPIPALTKCVAKMRELTSASA
ncbi:MAG: sugar phosphate isomerase/epimerase family protein [Planctomycetota bacterium]